MKALTSIAPNPLRAESQRAYLKSWRASGLEVVSLNHPSEIEWLAITYPEVQFVPTERTGIATFGRHYVLINAFMDWIAQQGETVMIVNADLHLEVAPGWWAQLWQRAVEGLPYLLQYNCAADGSQVLEPWGVSAFIIHPRLVPLFAESVLCMGMPWWDYWPTAAVVAAGQRLYTPLSVLAFHDNHPGNWSIDNWLACANELDRLTSNTPIPEHIMDSASRLSMKMRALIDAHTTRVNLGVDR
jgi:hypothetical protein